MNRMVAASMLAIFSGLPLAAQAQFVGTCTSEFPVPPPRVSTGLGEGVDDLVHSAYPLQWRTKKVVDDGWTMRYGSASATEKDKQIITIVSGQTDSYGTSHVAHEVGHATITFRENLSSREAYIRSRCTDEGFALGVNIASRRSIKQCVGVDTGVVTADVPYFVAWYEAMAADPPILYGDFGYAFCERNTESISGKNYLDYYGDWYDAHYLAIAPPSRFDPEPFFKHVESLGTHAAEGIEVLRAHWPAGDALTQSKDFANSWVAGPASLVDGIDVTDSEFRTARDDASRLILATMATAGPCVSLEAVRSRYPSAIMTDAPRSASPDARAVWSIYGPAGEIAFGFSYANPKCVSRVTVKPGVFPPSWLL